MVVSERPPHRSPQASTPSADLDKLDDAVRQCGLAQTTQVLDDVVRLQADRDSRVERICCELVLVDMLRSANWLNKQIRFATGKSALHQLKLCTGYA